MAVPAEIRAIERPKNTDVRKSGSMWAVIEIVGCIRKNGKNQPVEGKVIGHIIDGKFVSKEKVKITVSMKNFDDYEIAKSVSKDLFTDLSNVYPQDIAKHIYAIALLRSINPRMTNNKLNEVFNESFMSVENPELKLGKTMSHH